MRNTGRVAAVILLCVGVSPTVPAQSIQKCVDANGKVHYQDTPCESTQQAVATIKRDTSKPDEAAFIRSEKERMKLKLMQIERQQEELNERARIAKIEAAQAAARERAEAEARADARTRAIVDALKAPVDLPYIPGGSYYSPPRAAERPAPAPAKAPAPTFSGPASMAPKK